LDSNELFDFIKSNVSIDLDNEVHKECDKFNIPTRAISLMFNMRSVDTFLGLPFNIASYGLLLEIIAKSVNMVPDELIGNLGDVHLYSNHVEQAKEQIGREPFELPTLKINSGNENWYLLTINEIINSLDVDITFKTENYQSHEKIIAQLSN
jgi:thymidylate synthase